MAFKTIHLISNEGEYIYLKDKDGEIQVKITGEIIETTFVVRVEIQEDNDLINIEKHNG